MTNSTASQYSFRHNDRGVAFQTNDNKDFETPTVSHDSSITVCGPRCSSKDECGEDKKVSAVVDRTVSGRLVVRFLNIGMKSKQAQGQAPSQQSSQTQVSCQQQRSRHIKQEMDLDDEGFESIS